MFGLQRPLSKTLASADFDGLQAILYNSSLRESSHWLSKVNKKGEIFRLELEQPSDSADVGLNEKDCLCSDCATDDTGYGTDTDINAALRKKESGKQTDFSDIDDVIKGSCFDILKNNSFDIDDIEIQRVEENIDSLFQGVNIGSRDNEFSDLDVSIPSDINSCFSQEEFNLDSCFDDFTEVLAIKGNADAKSGSKHKDFLEYSKIEETMAASKKCECESKRSSSHYVTVQMKLRPQRGFSGKELSTVELCEAVLGIVPGHYGSSQSSSQSHRRKDRRVKIRSLSTNGLAVKYPEIRLCDCLTSINDQEVSWDNLSSILNVLLMQRQVKLVIKRNMKGKSSGSVLVKKKTQSSLVQLVSGSNGNTVALDTLLQGDWEPFYGALYLSLDGVNSDNMQAKEDIVYQFPRVDNKVIASRGMFITLAGTINDATQSTVQSTTLLLDNQPVHIVYHCEGQNLFVVSAPENRFSLDSLTTMVKDLVRLLQVTHSSIHDTFTSSANHNQLDCFFALLHQKQVSQSTNSDTVHDDNLSLSQSVKILPLANEIKCCTDRVLTEFEAADFGDMSDSYYGCRRSYSILGSCLFYKNYLISNHLPKDDLVDFSTYLKYHSLLNLSSEQSFGQLVVWREVHPTRHCQSVPEEQQFGYTEPLIARWFWLIVGYKNLIMCVSLETGGCTKVVDGVSPPDPFLIDQARAVLMQLYSQNIASHCQNILTSSPPYITSPEQHTQQQNHGHDLIPRSFKKLPQKDTNLFSMANGVSENTGSLRRLMQRRKDSVESDNSSESSGESLFKFSKKGRLFPETADLLHNINESKEEMALNPNRKVSVGVENCLFHFQYYDNLEGVVISSDRETSTASQLNDDIYNCFKKSCQKIKQQFDNARKIKEQCKGVKQPFCGVNDDFVDVREEGVMFTCALPNQDRKSATPLCYWVVGRCLSRSMRREVYVCFLDSTPQTVIELAYKLAMGYLPM